MLAADAAALHAALCAQPTAPGWLAGAPAREAPEQTPNRVDWLLADPDLAARWLAAGGECRWLHSTWAGVAPLLPYADRLELLTRPTDAFGIAMAEWLFGWLLARNRALPHHTAAAAAHRWDPMPGSTLRGQRLTLLGTGAIGAGLARIGAAFGMQVTGLSRSGAPVAGCAAVHALGDSPAQAHLVLHRVLPHTDVLVATLPDTPATRNLLDAEALAALPAHAVFANGGRAASVDHAALTRQLRSGRLAAALLDVFPVEPLPPDDPLWDVPNLTITPHVAAPSTPGLIARDYLTAIDAVLSGRLPAGRVDPARGY